MRGRGAFCRLGRAGLDRARNVNAIPEQREALKVDGYSVSPRDEAVIRGEVGPSRTLAAVALRMVTEAFGGRSRWEPGTFIRLRCREVGCPAGQTAPRRMTGGFTVKNGPVTKGWARLAVSSCDRNGGLPNNLPLVGCHPAPTTCGGRCVRAGRRAPFVSGPLSVARENLALTLRHEPGSHAPREGREVLPCVVGIHSQRMEQAHGKFFGIEYAQK